MFGYNSFDELIEQTFKNISNEFVYKWLIPIIVIINQVFGYVFVSVGGIWFLIFLYSVDFLTGVAKSILYTLKSKKLKRENKEVPKEIEDKVLVSKKFPRFLLTLFSAMLILGILKFAAIYSVVYMPLYSIFYAVFLGQQIISIAENLTEMKLLPLSILERLKNKISNFLNNETND